VLGVPLRIASAVTAVQAMLDSVDVAPPFFDTQPRHGDCGPRLHAGKSGRHHACCGVAMIPMRARLNLASAEDNPPQRRDRRWRYAGWERGGVAHGIRAARPAAMAIARDARDPERSSSYLWCAS
jgi:hypothetical protein